MFSSTTICTPARRPVLSKTSVGVRRSPKRKRRPEAASQAVGSPVNGQGKRLLLLEAGNHPVTERGHSHGGHSHGGKEEHSEGRHGARTPLMCSASTNKRAPVVPHLPRGLPH